MNIPFLPEAIHRIVTTAENNPYAAVIFELASSVYVVDPPRSRDALNTDHEALDAIAGCICDAAEDGNPIALILTPEQDQPNPAGMPTILRAACIAKEARTLAVCECPVRVFGDHRDENGIVKGFLARPSEAGELARWIKSIGGEAETVTALN